MTRRERKLFKGEHITLVGHEEEGHFPQVIAGPGLPVYADRQNGDEEKTGEYLCVPTKEILPIVDTPFWEIELLHALPSRYVEAACFRGSPDHGHPTLPDKYYYARSKDHWEKAMTQLLIACGASEEDAKSYVQEKTASEIKGYWHKIDPAFSSR